MDVVKMLKNGTSFKFTTLLNIVKKKKKKKYLSGLSHSQKEDTPTP